MSRDTTIALLAAGMAFGLLAGGCGKGTQGRDASDSGKAGNSAARSPDTTDGARSTASNPDAAQEQLARKAATDLIDAAEAKNAIFVGNWIDDQNKRQRRVLEALEKDPQFNMTKAILVEFLPVAAVQELRNILKFPCQREILVQPALPTNWHGASLRCISVLVTLTFANTTSAPYLGRDKLQCRTYVLTYERDAMALIAFGAEKGKDVVLKPSADEVMAGLVPLLQNGSLEERCQAARELAGMGAAATQAATALSGTLRSTYSPELVRACVFAVVRLSAVPAAEVMACLDSGPERRGAAIAGLSEAGSSSKQYLPKLREMLANAERDVQRCGDPSASWDAPFKTRERVRLLEEAIGEITGVNLRSDFRPGSDRRVDR